MRLWNKLLPFILLLNILSAQAISTIDTIQVQAGQQKIFLKPFIVDSSLFLFHDGRLIEDYQLNAIFGEIILLNPAEQDGIYHASYKYIEREIPLQVGPLYQNLPKLDSLLILEKDIQPNANLARSDKLENDISNLATTGTVYRNITLSPLSGSDFSGGLQLQLQGQLTDDIVVSGVLSDQSIPIQPEGTTQSLEEIDKVYLHVSHPIFQIMAGDIDYSINSGKYLNIERKLAGLRGELKAGEWSAQGTLASSQGRYNKLSFKGSDGSQGPYALTSETGSNDIIVLAGTEKVYLNGELVKRGENFDYTIDYSTGEITFTPRKLIDYDSDIYAEYQYSEYQYTRNVISSSLSRKLGKWGKIGLSWLKEKDQFEPDETYTQGILDTLKYAGDGDAIISGAEEAEDGNYILLNEIYIYSPNVTDQKKYSVTFQNDNENGEYVRRVSGNGEIYFEYIYEEDRNETVDLYSPYIKWNKPVNHEIFQVFGNTNPSKNTAAIWDVSLSNLDKNIYSNMDDNDNIGYAYNIELNNNGINLYKNIKLGYGLIHWNRSKTFNEISKDREALFDREWNLEDARDGQESLFSSGVNLNIGESLESSANWSKYNSASENRDRLTVNLNGNTKYVPNFDSYINKVQSIESDFYQYNLSGELLPGKFHPTFNYKGEYEKSSHDFYAAKLGFLYSSKNQNIAISITQRKDHEPTEFDSTKMELTKESIYGEVEISGKMKNDWSGKIIFKKRISDDYENNESLNYAIGTANLRYSSKINPVRWELLSKLEETSTELRAVVYDSVGVGLGSYRFDEEFDTYIADPNGDYISYTVLTGDRELTTHFNASQRFLIDFGKSNIKLLKNFDFRSDVKTEYRGESINIDKVVSPQLNDDQIVISKVNVRNEIDYNAVNSGRRIRNWEIYTHNLTGSDPRGSDLQKETEYGIEWREPINKYINSTLNFDYHNFNNSSTISELRNRKVHGWWVEEELKWRIERIWQISISALGGNGKGLHNEKYFEAYSYGIKFEGQRFIESTTSIKVRTEFNNSVSVKENSTIPPEALNGLPIGQSLTIYLQGQMLLGENLSLNTTASYINNSRYENFFSISGEIRAYF